MVSTKSGQANPTKPSGPTISHRLGQPRMGGAAPRPRERGSTRRGRAALPDNRSRPIGFGICPKLVACGQHDQIGGVIGAIDSADTGRCDGLNRCGDQMRVRFVQRRQECTGDHRPFGENPVTWHERPPRHGVVHHRTQQKPVQRPAIPVERGSSRVSAVLGRRGSRCTSGATIKASMPSRATALTAPTTPGTRKTARSQAGMSKSILGQHPGRSALIDLEVRRHVATGPRRSARRWIRRRRSRCAYPWCRSRRPRRWAAERYR